MPNDHTMDLTAQVIDTFHSHIDHTMQAIELLAPAIADAGAVLVQSLLSDGRIFCCGEGSSGLLAQHFAISLGNRFQRERPGLPAIALGGDGAALTAIAADASFNEIFARPIRTLAQPQDVLLLISHGSGSGTALQTIKAAHDRGLRVLVLCNDQDSDIQALLSPEDLELRTPGDQRPRFFEIALLTLNSLCELIELQLFGSEV
jgi:D-sedoheptulose 7-phosphate isomerase